MRTTISFLALALAAQSCAAFAPAPALGLSARFASSPLELKPSAAMRAPVTGLRVARAGASERLSSSLEVAASKIFPAGAGWQTASIVAGNAGFASNSLAFFATVGLGDLLGVFIGHTLYQFLKKKITGDQSIVMRDQLQIATLLGGAAFFSGSMWQPALNAMQALGLSFNGCFTGVGVLCTVAFFAGLRIWRRLLAPTMSAVERKSYPNQKADTQLAIAIGVATAFFVGTDVSFGSANWLAPVVGITGAMSNLVGICIAGLSTTLGFMAAQVAMTAALPQDKCWIDPAPRFSN